MVSRRARRAGRLSHRELGGNDGLERVLAHARALVLGAGEREHRARVLRDCLGVALKEAQVVLHRVAPGPGVQLGVQRVERVKDRVCTEARHALLHEEEAAHHARRTVEHPCAQQLPRERRVLPRAREQPLVVRIRLYRRQRVPPHQRLQQRLLQQRRPTPAPARPAPRLQRACTRRRLAPRHIASRRSARATPLRERRGGARRSARALAPPRRLGLFLVSRGAGAKAARGAAGGGEGGGGEGQRVFEPAHKAPLRQQPLRLPQQLSHLRRPLPRRAARMRHHLLGGPVLAAVPAQHGEPARGRDAAVWLAEPPEGGEELVERRPPEPQRLEALAR